MEKIIKELPGDPEIVALFKRISDESMIARPGPAILGRSRRGEIPAVRAEVSRKLVEDHGITIAEITRQVSVSTSAISKSLARSYSS
jgi:hypothetical protein